MTHYLVRRSHRVEEETLGTKVHTLCRASGTKGGIDSPTLPTPLENTLAELQAKYFSSKGLEL